MSKESEFGRFADILLEWNLVTEGQLREADETRRVVSRALNENLTIAAILLTQRKLEVGDIRSAQRELESRLAALRVPKPELPGERTRANRRVLFGQIALDEGFITEEQLQAALAFQRATKKATGKSRPIGAILGVKGFITRKQLDEVIKIQYGLSK